jgi:hypothetical protein
MGDSETIELLMARLEQLEGEVRDTNTPFAELTALRDTTRATGRSGDAAAGSRPRRLLRRNAASGPTRTPSAVSRRRLFGLLGGAAAAGAGLAVAGSAFGAEPAGAVTSVTLGNGTFGTGNDAGASETSITSTNTNVSFEADNTGSGNALSGQANTGNSIVAGAPQPGGSGAHLWLVPSELTGPPTGGMYLHGNFWMDSQGVLWQCVVAGSPGTWVRQTPLVTVTPVRVYDSRFGQLPSTGPKTPITNGSTVSIDVTGSSSGVPSGASTVLGNITVVSPTNAVFLTVFAEGATKPLASNINAGPGVTVANSFTSKIGTSNGISINCGGGPTDFIIDVFGYYL